MSMLGVITARGGSKRLPGKNITNLGGKPLIAWSIEVGLKTCDRLVVSTEDDKIKQVSLACGAEVVDRPESLAQDNSSSLPVVLHAAKVCPGYDTVLLLQPTSPFRTEDDVNAAIKLLAYQQADSVVSVIEFPSLNTLFTLGHGSRMRSIESGTIYTPNGAIYLITMSHLLGGGDWYGPNAYGIIMPFERSIDIDTHADFDAAAAMLDGEGRPSFSTDRKIAASAV